MNLRDQRSSWSYLKVRCEEILLPVGSIVADVKMSPIWSPQRSPSLHDQQPTLLPYLGQPVQPPFIPLLLSPPAAPCHLSDIHPQPLQLLCFYKCLPPNSYDYYQQHSQIPMGAKEVKPPPVPEKTLKEMTKEFTRQIGRLRRDFQREIYKLQSNERKMKAELEKMVKKNEPMSSKRILAQNLLRNQRYMQRYQKLDVQLQDMLFQLNTVSTTDTLVNVMRGMAEMMGKANASLNVKSIEQAMTMFQTEMEKGTIMQETIQDALDQGEEEIDDEAADQLIAQMELGGPGGKGGDQPIKHQEFQDFEARLNNL